MTSLFRLYIQFALVLLLGSLAFGLLATFAFLYPETYNSFLPFYQLRPFHVSAALFWIITGATAGIMHFKKEVFFDVKIRKWPDHTFIVIWIATILAIFACYSFRLFGGREYWEFPPILCLPLLVSWLIYTGSYFIQWVRSKQPKPVYVYMWSTGIFFFLVTFLEQNLWQIPWFRSSFLKEITVQWKSNGSMVGAWNQMIYGTIVYIMVKISGKNTIAEGKKVYFFYFLGLINLMFNWGHHIYNVPNGSWIRNVSYVVSVTELLFFVNIIIGFKNTLDERRRLKHMIPYRFLNAAEFWVFANLALVLFMSVPAVNRYTHGTHITVAHAMVATIGINSMILLGSLGYMMKIDEQPEKMKRLINIAYWISQVSLLFFWLSLVAAGIIKGYRSVTLNMTNFQEMMEPVMKVIKIFSIAGIGLVIGLGIIAVCYISVITKRNTGTLEIQMSV